MKSNRLLKIGFIDKTWFVGREDNYVILRSNKKVKIGDLMPGDLIYSTGEPPVLNKVVSLKDTGTIEYDDNQKHSYEIINDDVDDWDESTAPMRDTWTDDDTTDSD
jgi:hypothetical protein